jgi:hypothetical protein
MKLRVLSPRADSTGVNNPDGSLLYLYIDRNDQAALVRAVPVWGCWCVGMRSASLAQVCDLAPRCLQKILSSASNWRFIKNAKSGHDA